MTGSPSPFAAELEDRLIRYVQIDTTSDQTSPTSPSTGIQYDLLNVLVEELNGIGASDVALTPYGAITATIPATVEGEIPTVAFLAHVDTAPGFSGTGVKPVIHRNYDGSAISFPDDPNLTLSPDESPYLASKVGEDIVTASGTTILGADDKAGIAIVMAMARHLLENRDIPHGPIRIGFTPDEEIGRGVHPEFPGDLRADFGYTLDGGPLGEIVYETFSADRADIEVTGVSIHTGQAKGVLVNALHLAATIIATLPKVIRTPETTGDREGFVHVYLMNGTSDAVSMSLILRDFEMDGLNELGAMVQQVCAAVQATEPRATITCTISPQYRNMRYWLENDMRPVDLAREACRRVGIEPFSTPTRGGTDGSRLTELGVPTPNVFTGMQQIHGPLEYNTVQDMVAATEVCIEIAKLWAGDA
jgi:tripeptide aminopeptidase